MTNLQALGAAVNYPVDDLKLQKLLIDNGIVDTEDYIAPASKQFELATAGLYVLLVTSANIAEGGYNISMTDKSNMMKLATGIFDKYGIANPLKPKIKDRSNRW